MIERLPAFVVVAAVVIITPGPDTALTVRNVLCGGRRSGLATALGIVAGQLCWAAAVAVGLASFLREWHSGFTVLRLVGALYLTYLGALAVGDAWRGRPAGPHTSTVRVRHGHAWRQGLASNLSNPKMGLFFVSLLPQFTVQRQPSPLELPILAALFAVMTLSWLAAYCWVVDRVGDVLRRGRARRIADAVSGSALVALGARVALE
jgi:threonine/homoserine/homoserine lactone efflux protein